MPGVTKAKRAYSKALFEQGLIKCCVCNEIKPLDDFSKNAASWRGQQAFCKPCHKIQTRQRGDRKRAELTVIKETQGCMDCGYNEDGSKLHFHHRVPSTKLFEIGTGVTRSPQRIQEEIDKCDLLCAACHCKVEPRKPKGWKSKSTLDLEKK